MSNFFKSSAPPPATVTDLRSEQEKNLANQRASYFGGFYGQPDLGYQGEESKLDPIYSRMTNQFKEGVAQSAAEAGFDPLRYGPGVSATARGLQQMGENRTADEIQRKQQWLGYVSTGGLSSIGAPGRSVSQQQYGPSPFSQLIGAIL